MKVYDMMPVLSESERCVVRMSTYHRWWAVPEHRGRPKPGPEHRTHRAGSASSDASRLLDGGPGIGCGRQSPRLPALLQAPPEGRR